MAKISSPTATAKCLFLEKVHPSSIGNRELPTGTAIISHQSRIAPHNNDQPTSLISRSHEHMDCNYEEGKKQPAK